MSKVDLRYNLMDANYSGNFERPAKVIENLGITFDKWESHPIADQIWIKGCENVPDNLPSFITRM